MNGANAVGDERNGFQPVVSQQQFPQLAHFLVQTEIVGQFRSALRLLVLGHVESIFNFNNYELNFHSILNFIHSLLHFAFFFFFLQFAHSCQFAKIPIVINVFLYIFAGIAFFVDVLWAVNIVVCF